jgi:flavin-dependent dehydrogenase
MAKAVKPFAVLILTILLGCSLKGPASHPYDVVVLGGTPSAVAAAVAAARQGARVFLVAQNEHLGGMMASGLGNTDSGNPGYIGGISAEVFAQIAGHYRQSYGPESEQFKSCNLGFRFEPHVAEKVFERLVAAERIEVLRGWVLAGCHAELNRIENITVRHRQTGQQREIGGLVFIDATYTGDLFAEAGAPFYLGRESREVFGEKLAGHIYQDPLTRQPLPASTGAGDSLIQAYNYRLCLTDS